MSKGFTSAEEEIEQEDAVLTFFGCEPRIRVELYSGNFRTDTETGGCICADFAESWNKVSQCPVYFCDNISHEKFWEAIELLMEAGIKWSNHGGKIKEGNGYLFCDPPLDIKNKEKCKRRNK